MQLGKTRNITLDLLRGLFLCIIIVDHVYRFPNFFEIFTGRGQLWISAAEGFFLISGLLVGILRQSYQKLWRRSVMLYVLSIILTLVFTFWGGVMESSTLKAGLWMGNISGLVTNILLLRYTYGWADFLPYYAVFLFFSPLAVNLLRKWGAAPVLLGSSLLWMVRGTNFYAAWQILFVFGIVGGYYLPQLEKKLTSYKKPLILFTAFSLLASAIWVFKVDFYGFNTWTKYFFDKDTVGLGRIILSIVTFTAIYLNLRSHEHFFEGTLGKGLRLLGSNSLFTYVAHAIIILPLGALLPYSSSYILNTMLTLAVVVLIYTLVKARQVYGKDSTHTELTLDENRTLVSVDDFLGNREP